MTTAHKLSKEELEDIQSRDQGYTNEEVKPSYCLSDRRQLLSHIAAQEQDYQDLQTDKEVVEHHYKQLFEERDQLKQQLEIEQMTNQSHRTVINGCSLILTGHETSDIEIAAKQLKQAAGFCDKHKPNGGSRNCLICAVEKLSHTLSRISYICGQPNEMEVSDYSINYNEDEVVKQVDQLKQRLEKLANMIWETRWVSDNDDYQRLVGIAAEIRSGNFDSL